MATLRLRGVDTTTGQETLATVGDSLSNLGSLNVGDGITPSADNGDVVAGDGTSAFSYDASAEELQARLAQRKRNRTTTISPAEEQA